MSIQPEVSVIIPTFNRTAELKKAIQSVLEQTFQNFELIVVDDGSSEDIANVVENTDPSRITFLQHERNRGVSAARNTGMREAKGKYLAWLDSDDEWAATKLELQVNALKRASPKTKVCCTGYYLITENHERTVIPFFSHSWHKSLLLRCELPGSIIFFSRNLLAEIGYLDESLRRYEDWDWLIRGARKYDLMMIEKPLAKIYPSTGNSPKIIETSAIRFIDKHLDDFRVYGHDFARRALARRWLDIAIGHYFARSDREKVREFLIKSIRVHPLVRPAVYFGLVDTIFGTSLFKWALFFDEHLIRIFYRKRLQRLWSRI